MARKTAARRQQQSGIQRFFRETMGELRKVSWPTRQEAWSLTKIVIVVMVVLGIFLGVLDALFFRFFAWIISL